MFGTLLVVILVTGTLGDHERRFVHLAKRWPRGEVPYRFSNLINDQLADRIRSAISEIEEIVNGNVPTGSEPCLRFWRSADTESVPSYLYFQVGDNGVCGANSGMTSGRNWLFLDDDCKYKSGIMAMILLSLGLNYEHVRPDRDSYVKINYDNIRKGYRHMYQKLNESETDQIGLPYDFESLTHFSPYQNANDTSHPTMTSNWTRASLGNKDRMSDYDVRKLQIAYGCVNEDAVSCSFQLSSCELTNYLRYDYYHNQQIQNQWQARAGAMPYNGPIGDNSNGRGTYQYTNLDDAWLYTNNYIPAGTYCIHLHYCIASTTNSTSSSIRLKTERNNQIFAEGHYVSKAWTPLNVTHVETSRWQLWIGSHVPGSRDPVAVDDVFVTSSPCPSL
ncbi:zinc metalloproteinase nas-7-like isoform X2 [Pecten maximus]|uniref:zinc metalloproteinase nas-7-like isoform X2 n=1 Tax=Pecten maximus TaxID=6579 RepID=UPI001458B539|nr:zinc metalloproteinase nas-7-like isoform X2 [Pecten maximus]